MSAELTDRQRRILARLVTEYIDQGEPVSSAWLAEHSALGLSPATVRNILARLEELGLVHQPHTSAGRVPTDSGYRMYVDGLLGARKHKPLPDVEARLRLAGTIGEVLENASQELSRASHQIGVALAPASPAMRLQHIDFVNLDAGLVLIIVVGTGGQITHKVVTPSERIDNTTLRQAANYINAEFAGLSLHEARTAIVERLRQERVLYDALAARALALAQNGLSAVGRGETLHVQGASYLMDQLLGGAGDGARTLETLRALFRMIEEKHRLVELLSGYIDADGLTVVIGSEHVMPDLRPFSMVASTFTDGRHSGTVAVIGPTRMRYQRTIAVVEGVSHAVTRVLEGQ